MNNNLLIENEVLRARLNIRDFFLNNVVQEIYENIGQVLSLVRMNLDAAGTDDEIRSRMESTGLLVAKSIKDLRLMSKNFKPDTELLQESGFVEGIKKIIDVLYPAKKPGFLVKGKQRDVAPEIKLIAFNLLIKMLFSLKDQAQRCNELAVSFTRTALQITLTFTNENAGLRPADIKISAARFNQSITLIHGKFTIVKIRDGMNVWKLMVTIK